MTEQIETFINVYNQELDMETSVPVLVEYIHEKEWPATEYDPGESEAFEICSIIDLNTGKELTEDDIDMVATCEELEAEILAWYEEEKSCVEPYDD